MNRLEKLLYKLINHYDEEYYWKVRKYLIDPEYKVLKLKKLYWLLRLKRMESYNNASLGTYLNHGAVFEGKPILPHGLRGIHITEKAHIGQNCIIFHQTVIGVKHLSGGGPTIGDNCFIGAGAMLIGNIKIGNNVTVGANCVVDYDVPDNYTVVAQKSRMILKQKGIESL